MPKVLYIDEFLKHNEGEIIIDVRTPAEFEKGHLPGAYNVPLFTNEERAIVGTIYKKEGRQPAILKGLELVGPKLHQLVSEVEKIGAKSTVKLYCWRGGMRSGSVAWLMETYGFKTATLKGGYKSFRRRIVDAFATPYTIHVLGGRTGSGKSKVLDSLYHSGYQIIDLEKMAHHKGSSYGHIGELPPPTQESFENRLGYALILLDKSKPVWIEDESRMIGSKHVPDPFFQQMRDAPVLFFDVEFLSRVDHLTEEYGKYPKEDLIAATKKIEKRLGPQQTKDAIQAIEENRLKDACITILKYYDKTYDFGLSKRQPEKVTKISVGAIEDVYTYITQHYK